MTAREKALVIEDDAAVRQALVRMLRSAGYEPVEAEGGMEGLTAFRTHRPRLVISDLVLPDGMGLSAISAIREEDPDVPILAISGADGLADKDTLLSRALDRGATRALPKPFDASTFTRLVAALWGQSVRVHVDGRGRQWRVWRRRRFRFGGGQPHHGFLFDSADGAFFEAFEEGVSPLEMDPAEMEAVIGRCWYGEGGGVADP